MTSILGKTFRPPVQQNPAAWHSAFACLVWITSYERTPTGNPEFVIAGRVMRRSIGHIDIGHIRVHRWEYRVGVPAAQAT